MGSKAFQLPVPISRHNLHVISANNLIIWRCFSGGGSRWRNLDADVNLGQRSRLSDAYFTEDYDEEGDFGFKKRVWWSDDFDGGDDVDDDDDKGGHAGFGVQEVSIGFKWISKVLRSFGWMIPAVITSLVLGTGIDSIFMALALPIAQSAFSLLTETLWKRSSDASRTKSKSKKKAPARAKSNKGPRKTKESTTRNRPERRAGDYTSWVASSNASAKTGKRDHRDFGGWDELDNHAKGR
ncbi:hypothetical protein F511_37830 [Dorcoceras hygrometricum]|uniref:Uncharacterized protein n=1 Tax=Dorcoceras hygrometricum TaxID=472368 RepID=A0A2Z7CFT6_9LAMI|nr:hypothetical protein F511_37830 [Dorcoceras hygrometricum]